MPQNPLQELGRLFSEGLHSKVRQVEQNFKTQGSKQREGTGEIMLLKLRTPFIS